jgi:hypothetical protein
MIPVKQDKLYSKEGIGNGNCLAACLASLLEVPLWMVPPFDQMFGRDDWRHRISEWLERMFGLTLVRVSGHHPGGLPEFYIANGPSPRGVYHSTIFSRGALVHDPHYSDGGIKEVEWTWHLAPLDAR